MFYLLLLIITIPAFLNLLNPWYYSMHDFQHVARLFLFDQALRQGQLFPRWVDLLGFNFGYPLFNFYPPLIYYISEVFRLFGATYIWSIKLMIAFGYILGAVGTYLLSMKVMRSKGASLVTATLYTFFTYHAVLVYVRGALAEFFSMSILPFVFLSLHMLRDRTSISRSLFFGTTFAILILSHPLIAFPSLIFIGLLFAHLFLVENNDRVRFIGHTFLGGVIGLGMSAFFWLPSMLERKFTLVDAILTKELASYKIHFIEPIQLWFSEFGYGGSGAGLSDSMSFQLGKLHLALAVLSVATYFLVMNNKKLLQEKRDFRGYVIFAAVAIFMCLPFSQVIWDNVRFLWYLQFPWRFLTFAGIFLSVIGGFGALFLLKRFENKWLVWVLPIIIIGLTLFQHIKYFRVNQEVRKNDAELTSFEEITNRVSRSSFEFSPKGVPLTLSQYNTSIFDIKDEEIPRLAYREEAGLTVRQSKSNFHEKVFEVNASKPTQFQLNTFNFPGWTAYLDNNRTVISDNNRYKLITVQVPQGKHMLRFQFEDTTVRRVANAVSTGTVALCFLLLYLESVRRKKMKLA